MRFSVLSPIGHDPHPLTGELPSPADRFEEVIATASVAEELGFDSYSVGERHAGAFLSSSPSVVLGAIAARTSTIRLLTGVTVVAILDPVRVAEDFATLDQIARGRIELVVGKGAEAGHFDLFGLDEERQWDLQKEKYELLRRLWTEEGVDWEGEFRPPLKNVTTVPRPHDGLPRIWHGSATSLNSPELAAKHGDPLFTANAIQPREAYAKLIAHYRERFEACGHDPAEARVAAGSGGLLIADSSQAAVAQYKELYEARVRQTFKPHLAGKAGYALFGPMIHSCWQGSPGRANGLRPKGPEAVRLLRTYGVSGRRPG
ncbi:LLM class flavin-dependent oxidoreductase [Streptomyces bacillaris]|uniref:LLM class flavin-dependent oxidoreductase n=1 Tax=Streptomyces bacillaris TaxID=68179 RepID=UPI003460DBCA